MDFSPLSSCVIGFPRQEYWGGLPFPFPGDLPDPGVEAASAALQGDSLPLSHQGSPPLCYKRLLIFEIQSVESIVGKEFQKHSNKWSIRAWREKTVQGYVIWQDFLRSSEGLSLRMGFVCSYAFPWACTCWTPMSDLSSEGCRLTLACPENQATPLSNVLSE